MSKYISQSIISLLLIANAYAGEMGTVSLIKSGFYVGIGGQGASIDETTHSVFSTNTMNGAIDNYNAHQDRLAPIVQVGYWSPVKEQWLWGITAQWSYLAYKTTNVTSSHGQYIPNASFSSINIFGPNVLRDFSSRTKVNNEILMLLYAGERFKSSSIYLGVGPALFTAANHIYVSSVHTPNGAGDILVSNSVSSNQNLWGGAAQIGYNYYLNPTYFLGVNYTYAITGKSAFSNIQNAAIFNGATTPGPNTVTMNRSIRVTEQGVALSINKVLL